MVASSCPSCERMEISVVEILHYSLGGLYSSKGLPSLVAQVLKVVL